MASAEKDIAGHLQTLRADIAALTDTVADLVSDTAGIKQTLKRKVGRAARQATVLGEEALHEAEHVAGEALHAAARGANRAVHDVETKIEHNPLAAVLIALGFGLLIGMFTRK
jgi:ElaB/YqjD/DUF883 family membrane-anchored ribosome-binding protein